MVRSGFLNKVRVNGSDVGVGVKREWYASGISEVEDLLDEVSTEIFLPVNKSPYGKCKS